jgi:hypothetical protein
MTTTMWLTCMRMSRRLGTTTCKVMTTTSSSMMLLLRSGRKTTTRTKNNYNTLKKKKNKKHNTISLRSINSTAKLTSNSLMGLAQQTLYKKYLLLSKSAISSSSNIQ